MKKSILNKTRQKTINFLKYLYWKYNSINARLIKIPYPKDNQPIVGLIKDYNKFRPLGPKPQFCYVPANNILFSKNGKVLACSYNQSFILGNYPNDNLKEIIEGKNRRKLIAEHSANNLSSGCHYCYNFLCTQKYHGIKPLTFDKYSNSHNSKHPKVVEFDLSSRCNLNCIMCNEINREVEPTDSPYNNSFIEELTPYLRHAKELKFYGGEPFMIAQYYKIWEKAIDVNPRVKIFIITNGTILNKKIKNILHRGNFEIGVSIDSLDKSLFEQIRKGATFETVLHNIYWYADYCKKNKTSLSLSMTIFRKNWKHIPSILQFCNELDSNIYFSYLYNPKKMSLWTLASEEISEIKKYLLGFEFPKNTSFQKYNNKCYQDIIHHLDYWEKKNSDLMPDAEDKDEKTRFIDNLTNYLILSKKKLKIDSQKQAEDVFKQINAFIIESDNEQHLNNIYHEFNQVGMDAFFNIYITMPKDKLKSEFETWIKSCNFE